MHPQIMENVGQVAHRDATAAYSRTNPNQRAFFIQKSIGIGHPIYECLEDSRKGTIVFRNYKHKLGSCCYFGMECIEFLIFAVILVKSGRNKISRKIFQFKDV